MSLLMELLFATFIYTLMSKMDLWNASIDILSKLVSHFIGKPHFHTHTGMMLSSLRFSSLINYLHMFLNGLHLENSYMVSHQTIIHSEFLGACIFQTYILTISISYISTPSRALLWAITTYIKDINA